MLIREFPAPHHGEIFKAVNRSFMQQGYQVFLAPTVSEKQSFSITRNLLEFGTDGIIVCYTRYQPEQPLTVPCVMITDYPITCDLGCDQKYSSYLVCRHLIEHGHEIIAFAGETNWGNKDKIVGYRQALEEAGLATKNELIVNLLYNSNGVDACLDFKRKHKASAVVCSNDYVAGKLMRVYQKHGYKIPDDMAFVGQEGMAFSEFTVQPLTTTVFPYKELGERAVRLLLEKIDRQDLKIHKRTLYKPKLSVGMSCGCQKHNLGMLYWEGVQPTLNALSDYSKYPPENIKCSK
jgi:DNA-binding LacI/PurR family transcriptional regulator